jgi:hypothetical protein
MNVVEKSLDAYEIAENLYNDTIISPNDIVTIENCDLKTYFEMLLIIFLEGLYKFCKYSINDTNKFDLNVIKPDDIIKINSYLKKIQIKLNFKLFEDTNWNLNYKSQYTSYDKLVINSTTKLEDLYSIFYVFPNVYVVNFKIEFLK